MDDLTRVISHKSNPLVKARYGHCGIHHGDSCYILGGFNADSSRPMRECEQMRTKTMVWQKMPDLTIRRHLASCCIVDCKYLYVFGGQNSEPLDSIERIQICDDDKPQGPNRSLIGASFENLRVKLPIKMISMGALQVRDSSIMVFGGF